MNPAPTPRVRTACAVLVVAALWWAMPAWGVYRCSGSQGQAPTYSQWPCDNTLKKIEVQDTRTNQQVNQAQRSHQVAKQEASRFDRRTRQEARQRLRERPTAIDGPVRQVAVGALEEKPGKKRKKERHQQAKAHEPDHLVRPERPFKAVSPRSNNTP